MFSRTCNEAEEGLPQQLQVTLMEPRASCCGRSMMLLKHVGHETYVVMSVMSTSRSSRIGSGLRVAARPGFPLLGRRCEELRDAHTGVARVTMSGAMKAIVVAGCWCRLGLCWLTLAAWLGLQMLSEIAWSGRICLEFNLMLVTAQSPQTWIQYMRHV